MTVREAPRSDVVGANGTTVSRLLGGAAFLAIGIVFIFPMFWMVLSSFKTNRDIFRYPFGLPQTIDLGRWVQAWEAGRIGRYALNSAIVTGVSVTLILLFSAAAAFAISRYRFRGRNAVLGIFAHNSYHTAEIITVRHMQGWWLPET